MTPTTPPMDSTDPSAAIGVMTSFSSVAPSAIDTSTASCEITPTVIASTHRRLNVISNCAPIASSEQAASGTHSSGKGFFHVRIPSGAVVKNPRRQKLA